MTTTRIVTYDGNNDKEGIVNPVSIHDEVSKTVASEFVIAI